MLESVSQPLVHLVEALIGGVFSFIQAVIDGGGYWGIVLLMAIESANIPLPSEMILTYGGYAVLQGKLNFHLAALAGGVGCMVGSLPSYWLGKVGGRPFLERYGRWVLLTHEDLAKAEGWSQRYGSWTYFICRILPIVRTFISLPAGILQAPFRSFFWLSFIGSWLWSYALVYVGVRFGNNLETFRHWWHQVDAVMAGVILILGGLYLWKHFKPLFQKAS